MFLLFIHYERPCNQGLSILPPGELSVHPLVRLSSSISCKDDLYASGSGLLQLCCPCYFSCILKPKYCHWAFSYCSIHSSQILHMTYETAISPPIAYWFGWNFYHVVGVVCVTGMVGVVFVVGVVICGHFFTDLAEIFTVWLVWKVWWYLW